VVAGPSTAVAARQWGICGASYAVKLLCCRAERGQW
jgi:hypothetical protein